LVDLFENFANLCMGMDLCYFVNGKTQDENV